LFRLVIATPPEIVPAPWIRRRAISARPAAQRQGRDRGGDTVPTSAASVAGSGVMMSDEDAKAAFDAQAALMGLIDAFEGPPPAAGYLSLAEPALRAHPGHIGLLLAAGSAALLDGDPARARVFVKRIAKRGAQSPGADLIEGLALELAGRRSAARAVLARADLLDLARAAYHFPAGHAHRRWLARRLDEILDRRPAGKTATAKTATPRPTAKIAGARARSVAPAAPAAAKAAPPPAAAIAPPPPGLPPPDLDIPLRIAFDLDAVARAAWTAPGSDGQAWQLRDRHARLALVQGFDELLCLPHLNGVEPLWHQVETARKVLKQFRGRVLLADEVGLGKTIEAGMILKEYALRGMAARALVLVPAALVGQWHEELAVKFGMDFATTQDGALRDEGEAFWDRPRIVASIATARRAEHAQALANRAFDIVVVDEAHHLRHRASAGWRLVDRLNKRFLLLLSATPVQNDLGELYNLLTLLKPGIFSTPAEFRATHVVAGNPRQPADPDRLRALMRGAMIRNTRAAVALKLPRRHATTLRVEPSAAEEAAQVALAEAARRLAAAPGGARQRLLLRHLFAAAGSSPAAAAEALARQAERAGDDGVWAGLARRFAAIGTGAKEAALLELLARNPAEKKLVFVQARDTLAHLARRLAEAGIVHARFDGALTGAEKDAAVAAFRDSCPVLLCTQSGGEGRNMQFCNTLVNFDIPWNPMAIEQRIGRIDRIGQLREVFVFNLVARGTLDDAVLRLLEEKISMFELVVGEAGAILGSLEDEREFPDLVLDAWLETTDQGREAALTALGARLDAARREHEDAKALDERLFGQDFATA
jgi:superfamily II DNA or RNA helicase